MITKLILYRGIWFDARHADTVVQGILLVDAYLQSMQGMPCIYLIVDAYLPLMQGILTVVARHALHLSILPFFRIVFDIFRYDHIRSGLSYDMIVKARLPGKIRHKKPDIFAYHRFIGTHDG